MIFSLVLALITGAKLLSGQKHPIVILRCLRKRHRLGFADCRHAARPWCVVISVMVMARMFSGRSAASPTMIIGKSDRVSDYQLMIDEMKKLPEVKQAVPVMRDGAGEFQWRSPKACK